MHECDFVFSGIFMSESGKKLVSHIDNMALKKELTKCETSKIIKKLYADYTKLLNIMYINKTDMTSRNLLKRLPSDFNKNKIHDRYVIIMDTLRQMFHNCEVNIQYENIERSRRQKVLNTPTVISETTSVASRFSNNNF